MTQLFRIIIIVSSLTFISPMIYCLPTNLLNILNNNEATTPFYEKRTIYTNEFNTGISDLQNPI